MIFHYSVNHEPVLSAPAVLQDRLRILEERYRKDFETLSAGAAPSDTHVKVDVDTENDIVQFWSPQPGSARVLRDVLADAGR